MSRYGDYIYRNQEDTIRFKIWQTDMGWDCDIFYMNGTVITHGLEYGEYYRRKKDIKEEMDLQFGKLISINGYPTVTHNWFRECYSCGEKVILTKMDMLGHAICDKCDEEENK